MVGWGDFKHPRGGWGATMSLVRGKVAALAAMDVPSLLRIHLVVCKVPASPSPPPLQQ